MDYQTVSKKISDFMVFKAQIEDMKSKISELENNPPRLEKDVLSWEEAVEFAKNEKTYAEELERLRMGISNRENIIQNKESEIGQMLPVENHYILFNIQLDGQEQTYKIGYFPESYGFRMEKVE